MIKIELSYIHITDYQLSNLLSLSFWPIFGNDGIMVSNTIGRKLLRNRDPTQSRFGSFDSPFGKTQLLCVVNFLHVISISGGIVEKSCLLRVFKELPSQIDLRTSTHRQQFLRLGAGQLDNTKEQPTIKRQLLEAYFAFWSSNDTLSPTKQNSQRRLQKKL